MRAFVGIFGLVVMALTWNSAVAWGRNPGGLVIGFLLVLAARRWPARELRIAAAALLAPVAYHLYEIAFRQPTICYEDDGCVASWALPGVVDGALELVPYLVIAVLAWRLRVHDPLARRAVVPAREGAR